MLVYWHAYATETFPIGSGLNSTLGWQTPPIFWCQISQLLHMVAITTAITSEIFIHVSCRGGSSVMAVDIEGGHLGDHGHRGGSSVMAMDIDGGHVG